jgi:hypothetical protein
MELTTEMKAAAVFALGIFILFVVLLVQAALMRNELRGITKQQWSTPDQAAHALRLAHVVRSYAVRANSLLCARMADTIHRVRPEMSDMLRAVCGGGRDYSVPVQYKRVYWLVLFKDWAADALYTDVVLGAVKYIMLVNTTVRIVSVDHQQPHLKAIVANTLTPGEVARTRVFALAPAYDAFEVREAQDMREAREAHESGSAPPIADRGMCSFDVVLALNSDPSGLKAWLTQGGRLGQEARAHIWGFGMGR